MEEIWAGRSPSRVAFACLLVDLSGVRSADGPRYNTDTSRLIYIRPPAPLPYRPPSLAHPRPLLGPSRLPANHRRRSGGVRPPLSQTCWGGRRKSQTVGDAQARGRERGREGKGAGIMAVWEVTWMPKPSLSTCGQPDEKNNKGAQQISDLRSP